MGAKTIDITIIPVSLKLLTGSPACLAGTPNYGTGTPDVTRSPVGLGWLIGTPNLHSLGGVPISSCLTFGYSKVTILLELIMRTEFDSYARTDHESCINVSSVHIQKLN